WSSDVCSSDLRPTLVDVDLRPRRGSHALPVAAPPLAHLDPVADQLGVLEHGPQALELPRQTRSPSLRGLPVSREQELALGVQLLVRPKRVLERLDGVPVV